MIDLTLLVKATGSGQFEASVLGLPVYRAEAASRELAIAALTNTVLNQIGDAEIVSLSLPISPTRNVAKSMDLASPQHPWQALFGLFHDDVYFQEVMELIQVERDALGDEEIDPAYYMPQES